MSASALPARGLVASRTPTTLQRYDAGTRFVSGSHCRKDLPSKGVDGRAYLFSKFPVCKTGPQEMTGCAVVIRVRKQQPAGCTTLQIHLLFDHHAKVPNDMEPIRNLYRLWRALTDSRSIKPAKIPVDHLHFGMIREW